MTDAEGEQDTSKGEAARYRRRLRAAEGERDAALDQVAQLQRAILASACATSGVGLDALTAAGHDPAGLFDGAEIDRGKFTVAVQDTASRFGIRVGVIPSQGTGGPAPRAAGSTDDMWSQAFREAGVHSRKG